MGKSEGCTQPVQKESKRIRDLSLCLSVVQSICKLRITQGGSEDEIAEIQIMCWNVRQQKKTL